MITYWMYAVLFFAITNLHASGILGERVKNQIDAPEMKEAAVRPDNTSAILKKIIAKQMNDIARMHKIKNQTILKKKEVCFWKKVIKAYKTGDVVLLERLQYKKIGNTYVQGPILYFIFSIIDQEG